MHKYVIIPVKHLTHEVLDSVHQSAFSTVRKSLNRKHAILSYTGNKPECLRDYPELTHAEALEEMERARWNKDAPRWWRRLAFWK